MELRRLRYFRRGGRGGKKNFPRNVRQGKCCRCGHKRVAIILTPQSQARELLGSVEWAIGGLDV